MSALSSLGGSGAIINSFDQSDLNLTPPSIRDSHAGTIRRWWDTTKKYGTPAQLQSLRDRGYSIPDNPATFRAGIDGLANFGTESGTPSFRDLYGPEQAQRELDATNAAIAARAAAEKARQEQIQRDQARRLLESRKLFRMYHATKSKPVPQYRSNAITLDEVIYEYAISRGFKPADQFNLWPEDKAAAIAQLESTTYAAAWGRGL